MLYPGNIKKTYIKETNYANRGMALEYLINKANEYYIDNDIAFIYKKPTPIHVSKVNYVYNSKRITDAYYEAPSTLDYNGLYKGYYIEFDAKETKSKTSFPLSNIHSHQIDHIRNIHKHKGFVFLIIAICDKYYLLMSNTLLNFIDTESRKSIPYSFIKEHAYEINITLKGLDYLPIIDMILEANNEKN